MTTIIEGLGSYAISYAEMGCSQAETDSFLLSQWNRFGRPAGVFAAVADALRSFPMPLDESVADREIAEPIRAALGVTTSETELTAMLTARETLQRLDALLG